MGGDDSQKLLPRRGPCFPPGRGTPPAFDQINSIGNAGNIGLGSASSSTDAQAGRTGRLGHFCQARPGHFWKAPKGAVLDTVALPDGMSLSGHKLGLQPVARGERVVLSVSTMDSDFDGIAVYDGAHRSVRRVPVRFSGDLDAASWTLDGRISASGSPFASSIWRYHATGAATRKQ